MISLQEPSGAEADRRPRWLRLPQPLRRFLDEHMPEGVGWPHVFGSTLFALITIQALTGVLLSLNYSASTETAWESVDYIQKRAVLGAVIRGVHYWAASASIVVAALHIARVFIYAAYRHPRRWTWVAGVFLLLVLLGFGLTGYLLPWDLRAYFGTKVATEIPGSIPVVGPYLLQLIRGGEEVSPFTLTRFYSVHVIILPAMLAVLLGIHLMLVRRHGITPPWVRTGDEEEPRDSGDAASQTSAHPPGREFFPFQAVKDSVAIFVAVAVVFGLAVWAGAPLEAKADPTNASYVPRPEWYFLGLQHLLRIFQGRWQILGTFVIPNLIIVLLLAWPWLDRNRERRLRSRPMALAFGAVCAMTILGLTLAGYAAVGEEERRMADLGQAASETVTKPESEQTEKVAPTNADMLSEGERLYRELRCASCHGPDRNEVFPGYPPDLSYAGSKLTGPWMRAYLQEPLPIRYQTDDIHPTLRMPGFRLSADEAGALAAYLSQRTDPKRFGPIPSEWQSTPQRIEDGRRLFAQYQCLGCHVFGSEGNKIGPALTHVGRRLTGSYLFAFVKAPEAIIPATSMKNFDLWDEELSALVAFLQAQK